MTSHRPIIVSDTDVSMLRALRANGALAAELDNAEIVPAGGVPPNVVTMNSRVRFEDTATGASREITIVFPQDADASLGKVSILAPVGTALLGLAEGDSISWPFPDGQSRRLRVLEITFQPESHEMLGREAR